MCMLLALTVTELWSSQVDSQGKQDMQIIATDGLLHIVSKLVDISKLVA